jgi:hypothetical protein
MKRLKKSSEIYAVFEKLERYYDDDDRTFIVAFDNEASANEYVLDSPQHNYFVERMSVYSEYK